MRGSRHPELEVRRTVMSPAPPFAEFSLAGIFGSMDALMIQRNQ